MRRKAVWPGAKFPLTSALRLMGAFAGVATAHLMFGLPLFSASSHVRAGWAQMFSEFVATFGLLRSDPGLR